MMFSDVPDTSALSPREPPEPQPAVAETAARAINPRIALRTRDGRRRRIVAAIGLLAGDPVLNALVVIFRACHNGQQIAHLGDLFDLLLDEPLHELVRGEVIGIARDTGELVDLVG